MFYHRKEPIYFWHIKDSLFVEVFGESNFPPICTRKVDFGYILRLICTRKRRFWVHIVVDMYPKKRFWIHIVVDMYPKSQFWVHIIAVLWFWKEFSGGCFEGFEVVI